jgi:tripartite motif-containing protein 2/3
MISTSTNSTSLNLKQMIDETEQQQRINNFTNQFSTTNTDHHHHHTNDIIMNGINDILGIKSLSNSSKCSSTASSTTSSTSSLIISSSKKSSTQSLNKNDYSNYNKSSPSNIKYSNDLNCPLCKKRLQEPKLLNCLHVYCKNCLIAYYLTENSQFGMQNQQQSQLTCPKCKQTTPISEQYDIENLQDDHVLSNMLDMAMIEEQKLDCTSCKSEEKAVARCSDCAKFLCSNCVSAHENMTCFADHFVVRFQNDDTLSNNNEILPSTRHILKEPIHKPLYCKYHLKENLKFFCLTCQIPICSDCITLHQQPKHQYERIVDVETRNIIDLENILIKAKETINVCQTDYQLLDQYLNDLQEQLETGKQMIEETFQTFRAMLEKKRNELTKEMEEKHSNKEASLMDIHNIIDTLTNQLNHCVRYGERVLENGNGAEISMLKRLIISQFKHLFGNMPQMNQMDFCLKFQTDCKKFEKVINDSFGHIDNSNHKQQNMIQSSSSTSSSVSSQSSIPSNVTIDQIKNLHKQFERLQANSSTTQIDQQQWILANLIKQQQQHQQQIKQINEHESSVPISPTSSLTDELYMERLILNKPNSIDELQQNLQRLQLQQPKQFTSSAISPPIITNPTSEWPIINSNANNTRQASRCETPSSYLANALNLIGNGQLDGLNSLEDLLQPNNLNVASVAAAVLAQQQQQQQQQNLNQLTKFLQPPELNALANLNELALTATLNGNNNGNNLQSGAFSDVQSNSSQSPPLGAIGSNINSLVANINSNNQSAFAGNGNLNPPVRQNGKMTNMQIRTKFGTLGSGKAQFNSPHGFCLGIDEEIIVADTNNHRIQIFDKNGEYKYSFGSPGKEEGQLWYPRKVTVMRDSGKFVVCDRGNERSRMQIFNKNGHFMKKISIKYIDIVAGLAITHRGEIVAVDSVSPTVFRISEAGDLLKWFDCSDYMREPSDIAISGDEYFVCDFKGHCVVVFNDDGTFLRRIGGENITNFPNGIDVSDAGDVLVGDSHGNRFHVAVFSREGAMLSEFECPYVKVSRCCGLKITSEGYVVTLAKNNHHVLVLNTLYVA